MKKIGRHLAMILAGSAFVLPLKAQLLKGTINNYKEDKVTIYYISPQDWISFVTKDVPVTNGFFSFDENIPNNTQDIEIHLGKKIVAARLLKGKTQEMTITINDGKPEVIFKGPDTDVNRVVAQMGETYDIMHFYTETPIAELRKEVANIINATNQMNGNSRRKINSLASRLNAREITNEEFNSNLASVLQF